MDKLEKSTMINFKLIYQSVRIVNKYKLFGYLIVIIVGSLSTCKTALAQSEAPDELIKGTWIGVMPEGITWEFTESKLLKGGGDLEYFYSVVEGATTSQCSGSGYDAVYNSDQWVLIQQDSQSTDCFMIDHINKNRLVLFNERVGRYLSFEKE